MLSRLRQDDLARDILNRVDAGPFVIPHFLAFFFSQQTSNTWTGTRRACKSAGWGDERGYVRPDIQEQRSCTISRCCKITSAIKNLARSCISRPR